MLSLTGHRGARPESHTPAAAVVGAGRGVTHERWLSECPGVTVLPMPGDKACARIREGALDAVVVASPTHAHQELVTEALRHDLLVVCETPLAPSTDVALLLAELAAERAARAYVPFQWRQNIALQEARSALLGGEVGELLTVDIVFDDDSHIGPGTRWPWRERRATAGGGALAELGSHAFDLLSWSTGLRLWTVEAAWTHRLYDTRRGPEGPVAVDVDDAAQAELRPLGVPTRARVQVSRISPRRQLRLTAMGSRGILSVVAEAGDGSAVLTLTTGARSLRRTVPPHAMNPYRPTAGAKREAGAYARAQAAAGTEAGIGTDGLATFDDGLAALRLVAAAQSHGTKPELFGT